MKRYSELIVWQKSKDLAIQLYANTESFPKSELYGLTNQIRRAAVSIPANIAEGYGRNSLRDYIRFLNISKGSLFELQTLLEISLSLKYLEQSLFDEMFSLSIEIEKMLVSLVRNLKAKEESE